MSSCTRTDLPGGQEAVTEAWQHSSSKRKGLLRDLGLPHSVGPSTCSPTPQAIWSGPHHRPHRLQTPWTDPNCSASGEEPPRAWPPMWASAFLTNVASVTLGPGIHSHTGLGGGALTSEGLGARASPFILIFQAHLQAKTTGMLMEAKPRTSPPPGGPRRAQLFWSRRACDTDRQGVGSQEEKT